MGNLQDRLSPGKMANTSDEKFKFHDQFEEDDSGNGLYFNKVYIPEEIVILILSYVDPEKILEATKVCKKWCNIIKSEELWSMVYQRRYRRKGKKQLPWFVFYSLFTTDYFDKNLIKNGNGQDQYQHWTIVRNYGDGFKIEKNPCGAQPLPLEVPEFNGHTSCFATSYYECNKLQSIPLDNNLIRFIMNEFKPHIYTSEWVTARFDCGCVYNLWCHLYSNVTFKMSEILEEDRDRNIKNPPLHSQKTGIKFEQWEEPSWNKVELIVKDYPTGVKTIIFQHEGKDTLYWKGHYGAKMAGAVVKILFDSIEPLNQ